MASSRCVDFKSQNSTASRAIETNSGSWSPHTLKVTKVGKCCSMELYFAVCEPWDLLYLVWFHSALLSIPQSRSRSHLRAALRCISHFLNNCTLQWKGSNNHSLWLRKGAHSGVVYVAVPSFYFSWSFLLIFFFFYQGIKHLSDVLISSNLLGHPWMFECFIFYCKSSSSAICNLRVFLHLSECNDREITEWWKEDY